VERNHPTAARASVLLEFFRIEPKAPRFSGSLNASNNGSETIHPPSIHPSPGLGHPAQVSFSSAARKIFNSTMKLVAYSRALGHANCKMQDKVAWKMGNSQETS
jgi:hypothetical protein